MSAKITLFVTEGNLKGQEYIFDERTTCIIGRAADCNPQLPDDQQHNTISRYHCLLDINPPLIRVRDFGSLNGTYVNGIKIGQRQANQTPEEAAKQKFPEHDLYSGDEIQLGNTVFQVSIEVATEAGKITPDAVTISIQEPESEEIIPRLVQQANAGDPNLAAIQDYTIVKLLGKGGFGAVYLVRHNQTGELVALKTMLPQVVASQSAVTMFLRETENTRALQHPNVVKLLDSGHFYGTFFFTIEYCNGGSVIDLIQERGRKLSIDEAVPIILQVLDGLTYAHSAEIPYVKLRDSSFGKGRGLIHRDLKPANIFLVNVNGSRIAKIGDYGLGKAFDIAGLSGQTLTGTKGGTPCFLPRQQVINFKYAKPEVDIWATCASLYYMITGDMPRNFNNEDPFLTVLKYPAVPIRQRDNSIPTRLAEVIDLALIDNPEITFKNAADFKQALLSAM